MIRYKQKKCFIMDYKSLLAIVLLLSVLLNGKVHTEKMNKEASMSAPLGEIYV